MGGQPLEIARLAGTLVARCLLGEMCADATVDSL